MKKLLFASLLGAALISCETGVSEDAGTNSAEVTNNAHKVSGRSVNSRLNNRQAPQQGAVNILICEFSIGRNSKACRGFGICDFEWFPDLKTTGPTAANYQLGEVWEYADGNYDLEIYLQNAADDPNDPDLDLIVDEDIITNPTSQNTKLLIKAGTYHLDTSLGTNGGYNIPVFAL